MYKGELENVVLHCLLEDTELLINYLVENNFNWKGCYTLEKNRFDLLIGIIEQSRELYIYVYKDGKIQYDKSKRISDVFRLIEFKSHIRDLKLSRLL